MNPMTIVVDVDDAPSSTQTVTDLEPETRKRSTRVLFPNDIKTKHAHHDSIPMAAFVTMLGGETKVVQTDHWEHIQATRWPRLIYAPDDLTWILSLRLVKEGKGSGLKHSPYSNVGMALVLGDRYMDMNHKRDGARLSHDGKRLITVEDARIAVGIVMHVKKTGKATKLDFTLFSVNQVDIIVDANSNAVAWSATAPKNVSKALRKSKITPTTMQHYQNLRLQLHDSE
jgi:hypothetical protein